MSFSIQKRKILFLLIFTLAAYLRLTGVNWDQGQHLHPDERFLVMVTNAMRWPGSFERFLDTATSTMNPHNIGYSFFVYGTFPLFFTKWIATLNTTDTYEKLLGTGRMISGYFDLGTTVLVFLIAKKLIKNTKSELADLTTIFNLIFPYLAMFFYAISVLPIQLSHFYAVDTYLNFFTTLCFYLGLCLLSSGKRIYFLALMGVSLGLAVASKISAILIAPTLGYIVLNRAIFSFISQPKKSVKTFIKLLLENSILAAFILGISGYLTYRIVNPYTFLLPDFLSTTLNPKFINNMKALESFDSPLAMFPPAVQWLNRTQFIFPLRSLVLHGLGIPIFLLSISGLFFFILQVLKMKKALFNTKSLYIKGLSLAALFIATVFTYQGHLYTMNMRYFLMMYPFLALFASFGSIKILYFIPRHLRIYTLLIIIILALVWPISFSAIYQRNHSRVIASQWIYDSIPSGSTLSYEHWDDPLPLSLPSGLISEQYKYQEFTLYEPDVYEKWIKMSDRLQKTDYIIMSSNRLWGSIPRVPYRFPIASKYYKALFDGSLGFEKIKQITSLPCFPTASTCLFEIDDTNAEESFTVYDHPEVLIYKKKSLNQSLINSWIEESKSVTS